MDKDTKRIVLLTDVFPDLAGSEYRFLERHAFDIVVFTEKTVPPIPPGGEVVLFGPGTGNFRCMLKALWLLLVTGEVFVLFRFPARDIPRAAKTAVGWAMKAYHRERMIRRSGLAAGAGPVYSYWADSLALTAIFLARKTGARCITRMHGYDLYEERHAPAYLPFRRFVNRHMEKVVFISEHGRNYYARKYPAAAHKYEVNRLGTPAPSVRAEAESPGALHLVSCSYLVPVKRIHLLVDALAVLSETVPFFWTHLGDGPLYDEIRDRVSRSGLSGRVRLAGGMDNAQVHAFYARHRADLFVNVSESEGLPVSIMEAMSYGIPAVATAVGGSPEIVEEGVNGFLLPADAGPREIAEKIAGFAALSVAEKTEMGQAAAATWKERYSAEKNFRAFAGLLAALR